MPNYFFSLQKYQGTAQVLRFIKMRFKISVVRFLNLDVAG